MYHETLVIGGGIAGMSCALELKEAGRDVAIVTDELGGRVCYEPEYGSNFGAVFFMENYTHAKKLLKDKGVMAPKLGDLMLHSSPTKVFKGNSLTMLASLPQMNRFTRFMNHEFIPEYNQYKKECETQPVAVVMDRHPKLKRYYQMKASELIHELGIDKICDNFVSKFAYACTGSRIDELNALDFLNVAQGVVIPIFDFSFDREEFTRTLDGKVYIDTIVSIERVEGDPKVNWKAIGRDGTDYTCLNMVIAATGLVNQKLLGIEEIRQPTRLLSYLVEGTAKPYIAKASAHYFSDQFDIIAINKRSDGRFNVYSRTDIDLNQYFDNPKIIHYRDWPEALFTYGDIVQPQDFDDHLWIASDINGLGLEPAAISGVYAANRILGRA